MIAIKALLIDLDGVIRTWHGQDDPATERAYGLPPGAIRRVAFAPERLLPAITGRVADAVWREQIAAELGREFPEADTAGAVGWWSASSGDVDLELVDLLSAYRQRIKVVLVTNATSRLPHDLRLLGLDKLFDHVINSSAVGAVKPDPAIFAAALAAAGVQSSEALFVDDKLEFVEAARRIGIAGHHYVDAESFRAVLQQAGA